MRRLLGINVLIAVSCFASSSARAQYANKVYYSPGHPLSPTTSKQCNDFEAEWAKDIAVIENDHQKCLDAHDHDKSVPGAGDLTCSRSACQSLHDIMFRFRRESKVEIEACNKQVDEYQKAEQARKDEEARRKAEDDARRRQAEEDRRKQQEAADEAKRRRAEEADRLREAAAQRAAAEAARRAQALEAQQKAFDAETKRRAELTEKLSAVERELAAKLADAQRKQADEQKAIADRQMEAMKSEATAPPPSDADKMASGIDLSGVEDKSPGSDNHLFAIDATTASQVFTEIGQRLHEAGQWVVDQGVDAAKEKLIGQFTKGDYAPYHDAVEAIVEKALPSKEVDLDRGSWLREALIETVKEKAKEKATDYTTDWLHDQSVTAYAQRSDDPIEYQVNRGFSATQVWNSGFGFRAYLTKIHDEAMKGILIALGMMTDDLERMP